MTALPLWTPQLSATRAAAVGETAPERRQFGAVGKVPGDGRFVAAMNRDTPFFNLASEDMPGWLVGARPSDHEPRPKARAESRPARKG